MISRERLVLLYQETSDKKCKERIFYKIYKTVEKEAYELCHYYRNLLNYVTDREAFFEDALQEARLCLVKCLEKFDITKDTKLSTFYRTCLANHLSDVYRDFSKIKKREVIDSELINYVNGDFNDEENIVEIDNRGLKEIFDKHIDKLPYSKPIHKQIFKDYLGFGDKQYKKESFGNIGTEYKLSRMAIKKITDKYFRLLIKSLKSNGDMERIKEYL